jgi:hypothetical protein
VKLNLYRVEYFSHIEWQWFTAEMVAVNEEQIQEHIDSECNPEFRYRPYWLEKEDSLSIEFIKEVDIPFITQYY